MKSNRHKGVKNNLSRYAKFVEITFLNKPIVLKSPIVRRRNTTDTPHIPHVNIHEGKLLPLKPIFPKTISIARKSRMETIQQANFDGYSIVGGILALNAQVPPKAQYACRKLSNINIMAVK